LLQNRWLSPEPGLYPRLTKLQYRHNANNRGTFPFINANFRRLNWHMDLQQSPGDVRQPKGIGDSALAGQGHHWLHLAVGVVFSEWTMTVLPPGYNRPGIPGADVGLPICPIASQAGMLANRRSVQAAQPGEYIRPIFAH
jgi:hypothetical protein